MNYNLFISLSIGSYIIINQQVRHIGHGMYLVQCFIRNSFFFDGRLIVLYVIQSLSDSP